MLNGVAEGSTVDYSALMDQSLVSKSKYSLKKARPSPPHMIEAGARGDRQGGA